MKRLIVFLLLLFTIISIEGFKPRSYSDLAEYKRLPFSKRIKRMEKIGKEYFLRRKYEEARNIFKMIKLLDKTNLTATLWLTKINEKIMLEKNERIKKQLYKKYGMLTPKELIYHNWVWGPTVGAFKVRYSKPKPYKPPVIKRHPKATDAQIKQAEQRAKSGKAEDLFELAMEYWSRKETNKAIDAFYKAVQADPKVLANDDEMLLASAEDSLTKKIRAGKATAQDFLAKGRLAMLQGDTLEGLLSLIKAASLQPKLKKEISPYFLNEAKFLNKTNKLVPSDIYSFRQAYLCENNQHYVYIYIKLQPKPNQILAPIDITLPQSAINKISIKSKDILFAYGLPTTNESTTRIWLVLNKQKDPNKIYEIKLILTLNYNKIKLFELSNFNPSTNIPDNFSFVIAPQECFGENYQKGEIEETIKGLRISGVQLGLYDGRGPFINMQNFENNSIKNKINVWNIMNKEVASYL